MKATWKKVVLLLLASILILPAGWIAPLDANTPTTVYHETFESGVTTIPAISGGTVTENVYEKTFPGNEDGGAFYLKERKETYDGLDFRYEDIGLDNGTTYTITINGFVDSDADVPAGSVVAIQPVNPATNVYDDWIANTALAAGQAFTISASFTANSIHSALRLGSNEAAKEVPYYVGDVLITTAPPPSTEFTPIVIGSYNFDDGKTQGWQNRGSNVTASDETSRSGDYSLKVTGRTANWHGTELSVTNLMLADAGYEVSAFAKLVDGQPASDIKFTMVVKADGAEDQYIEVTPLTNVTDQEWVELKATTPFTVDEFTSLTLYAESPNETLEFYLDDISIKMVTPPVNIFHTFEDGQLGGWERRNGAGNIEVTDEDNFTPDGQYSLKTTVTEQYDGALLDVAGKMQKGHQYKLSARVKMAAGEQPAVFRISVQYGDSSFANVSQNATVTEDGWVLLDGLYTQSVTPGSILNAYVEIANSYNGESRTFLVDDFRLTYNQPIAGPNPDYSLASIAEVYEDYFPIGNIMNPGDFNDDERLTFLKKHHTLLSAENGMKPEYAYNSNRQFDFTNMDRLVNNALDNGFDIHGHVLVWHSQSPEWLHTDTTVTPNVPLSKAEALENLRTHIRTVVEKYGEKMISWDVVNEAVEDSLLSNPEDWRSTLRNSGWLRAIGPDFIYESFKAAREVIDENGWDIELYYNDYNDDNQRKATAIAAMVKELNETYAAETNGKVLIDGVGMQSHYNLNTNPENVRASIERFIDIGVKVGVTELDVMAGSGGVQTEQQAKAQAYIYAQLFKIYKEYSDHITRVTFWGIDDGTSWRKENNPLIFDSRYQAKPAYYAVINPEKYIEENPPEEKEYLKSDALYATPVIDGEVDSVWANASVLPLNRYQQAHNGATGVAKVLWDDNNLYVLVQVNDDDLDDSSSQAHEQDSVEVFLDENNAKATSYQEDDAQYRVNFNNIASFNPATAESGFESKVIVEDSSYRVEMKIPFKTINPANNMNIGFDAQINDASGGARQSVAIWNDFTGAGWQDPSVFGVLTLKGKPSSYVPPTTSGNNNTVAKPVVTVTNGQANVNVSADYIKQQLDQGQKQIVIEIDNEGISASSIQLPKASLNSNVSYTISFKTPHGTIVIPSSMLSSIQGITGDTVTISISSVNTSELAASVREQIGNRPVIKLNVLADGKVINWNNPNAAVTVSIPYSPSAAELANPEHILIWYIDEDGNVSAVPNSRYVSKDGVVRFNTTHFSTYAVSYDVKSFDDLAKVPWASKAIEVMASRQIINGVSANAYNPSDYIKRADFIALLVRALELQGKGNPVQMFNDVKDTDYFYEEVKIAKQLGIASGTGNNLLNPHESITRQDAMVLVVNAMAEAGKPLTAGSLDAYSDAAHVSQYARFGASALIKTGIINGIDGKIMPKEALTRAQAAVILYRIWSY